MPFSFTYTIDLSAYVIISTKMVTPYFYFKPGKNTFRKDLESPIDLDGDSLNSCLRPKLLIEGG